MGVQALLPPVRCRSPVDAVNLTIEDWLNWTETTSVYVTHGNDVLPRIVKEAWGHLRLSVLHYLRHVVVDQDPTAPGSSYNLAARRRAREHLLRFARIAEEVGAELETPDCSMHTLSALGPSSGTKPCRPMPGEPAVVRISCC